MSKVRNFIKRYIVEDLESMDKQGKRKFILNLKSIMLGFLIIWFLSGVVIYTLIPNWSDRGTFGDMFGAINALFSAFAFGGLVYTLFIQRYELSLQRKELAMQRLEVARNADQLEQQKNVMVQQSFENTFFKMIELHHNIIASMDEQLYGDHLRGRRVIAELRDTIRGETFNTSHKEDLVKSIENFLENHGSRIKHYINNYFCILELVEQYCLKAAEDLKSSNYSRIAISQLSENERVLIFYTLGYKKESRLLLEKFVDLLEFNSMCLHHCSWMRQD